MVRVSLHQSVIVVSLVVGVGASTISPAKAMPPSLLFAHDERKMKENLHQRQQRWFLRKRTRKSHSVGGTKRKSSDRTASSDSSSRRTSTTSTSSSSDASKSSKTSGSGSSSSSSTSRKSSSSDKDDDKSSGTKTEESEGNGDKTIVSDADEESGIIPPTQPSVGTSLYLQTSTASPTIAAASSAQVESAAGGDSCSKVGPNEIFGNKTLHERLIQVYYQVETTESLHVGFPDDTLLPRLETAIADRLIPFLIRECRDNGRRLQDDMCVVQGLSSFPADIILPGVGCVGTKTDPSNDCFVVDAGVSIFIESEFDCLDIDQVARAELKTAMDAGAFDRLDEAIVNIKYVEKSDLELSEVKDVAKGNDGADKDDGPDSIPSYGWVLVGLGSILFVLTVCLIHKNVRHC